MKTTTKSHLIKATFLACKKSFNRFSIISLGIVLNSTLSATQYCQQALTTGANTVLVSMESPSTNTYVVKIESAVAMTGLHDGSWVTINTNQNVQAFNYSVLSSDKLTCTITLTSTTVPNFYTKLNILYPALVLYDWPTGITWGTCTVVAGLPTLAATTAASAITATTATTGGNVTDIGASAVTARGVCWSSTSGPTVALATKTTDGSGSGSFTSSLTGLTSGVTYYVKSYATNTAETSYGAEISFTTVLSLTAAPTPTVPAASVISIYSDAYTSLTGTNFTPNWGQTTVVSDYPISENATKKYASFNYQGMNFVPTFNASTMTKLHIDIYPTTQQEINLSPISSGAKKYYNLTPLIANTWNSFDVSLTNFTGVSIASVDQFEFECLTTGLKGGTFFMDNLYFYNDAPTFISEIPVNKEISLYPNPFVNNVTISAQSEIGEVFVRNLLGQIIKTEVVSGTTKTIDLSVLPSGNYFVVAKMRNGGISTQKITKL